MDFKIKFRAFRLGDEKFINALRNDEAMESKIGGVKRYVSIDREEKWIRDLIMNDDSSCCYFAVTELGSDEIIGYTSVSDVDYRNGKCFWSGIKLARNCSGKGYGTQVALLVLKYVFEELRMVRCIGKCQEDHMPAFKMMKRVGFIEEGLMRKYIFKNGCYINMWLMSITDDDYQQVKKTFSI